MCMLFVCVCVCVCVCFYEALCDIVLEKALQIKVILIIIMEWLIICLHPFDRARKKSDLLTTTKLD